MAIDLRQVMAAFLTFSMFVMLGNMIKKDHIDPFLEPYKVPYRSLKLSKPADGDSIISEEALWMETNQPLKPCWKTPSSKSDHSNSSGYIFFSLAHGPEYHASQVANAVAVAKHLGAKLAIPDIRGTKLGDIRKFEEFYDVNRFVRSLKGIVQVDNNPTAALSKGKLPIVRVPHRVSKELIASKIEPIFRSKRNLKIVTYDYSSSRGKEDNSSLVYECVATFEALKLQNELQRLVDSMVGRLRSMSERKGHRRFVAVDLKLDTLKTKRCEESNATATHKRCYNAREIGEFLDNVGFHNETTVYVTQTGWSSSLDGLRNKFPNTFTKDAIMGVEEKVKLMDSEREKYIDLYTCVEGEVFVAAYHSRFYSEVIGRRIAETKTRVFLPPNNASTQSYLSPYIANKTHFAYSCFC